MAKFYAIVCFSIDGYDMAVDEILPSLEEAEKKIDEMGSKWIFYPIVTVFKVYTDKFFRLRPNKRVYRVYNEELKDLEGETVKVFCDTLEKRVDMLEEIYF